MEVKLHLGCGESYLAGYVNIDLPTEGQTVMKAKADVYKDIRELAYADNSVDEVRTHHLLEHFSRQEILKHLFRWRRWLKPGGKLVLETPDFETTVKKFATADLKTQFKIARHIFGSQESPWAFHLDYWGEKKFRYILDKLGFEDIQVKLFTNYTSKYIPSRISKHANKVLPSAVDFLDNILVTAKKSFKPINEKAVAKEILSLSLIGKEKEILDVWLKEQNL